MNATYVRVYSDEAGESHFEDVEIALEPQDFAPPAAPATSRRSSKLRRACGLECRPAGAERRFIRSRNARS